MEYSRDSRSPPLSDHRILFPWWGVYDLSFADTDTPQMTALIALCFVVAGVFDIALVDRIALRAM